MHAQLATLQKYLNLKFELMYYNTFQFSTHLKYI